MVDPMRNKLVHKVRPLIFCVLGGLTLIYAMLAEERDSSLLSFGFIVFWAACLELWNPFSKPFRHKDVSSYEIDFLRRHSLRIHMILALSIWFAAIPSGFYLLQSDLWNNSGWIKGLLLILLLIAFVSGFYAERELHKIKELRPFYPDLKDERATENQNTALILGYVFVIQTTFFLGFGQYEEALTLSALQFAWCILVVGSLSYSHCLLYLEWRDARE